MVENGFDDILYSETVIIIVKDIKLKKAIKKRTNINNN